LITSSDVVLLLTQLQNEGFETKSLITDVLLNKTVSYDTLKFINDNRPLDCYNFIEKVRRSYNNGNSKLYKNLVAELKDTKSVLTTLASLQLQVLLFMDNVSDKTMFLSHMRFDEIQKVFLLYYKDGNLIPAIKLLEVIKADVKIFEQFRKENKEVN